MRFSIFLLTVILAVSMAYFLDLLPYPFTKPQDVQQDQITSSQDTTPRATAVKDLGPDLFSALPTPALPPATVGTRDPIQIPGHFNVIEKLDVPSQVPGQILFIGEEIQEGAAQVAGVAPFLQGQFHYARVNQGGKDVDKIFRRLYEGEIVQRDQVMAMIDPAKAMNSVLEKKAKQVAAVAEQKAAADVDQEAYARLKIDEGLFYRKVIAEQEFSNSKLTRIKTYQELVTKTEGVKLAEIELELAEIILNQHQIRNRIPVQNSVIKTIYKNRGEAVKELEPVMNLYSLDRLLAEAFLDVQYYSRVRQDLLVTVEPTLEAAPLRIFDNHKAEVTCVAVTRDQRFVSGSEDMMVHVWMRESTGPVASFPHDTPIRSIACSPRESQVNWCIAGGADGSIAIWDLAQPSRQPVQILKKHSDAVTALAFSPDGEYFASGSADGSIILWSRATALKGQWAFPFDAVRGVDSPHTGVVTALHFTPQCKLVSASRDNTIRVWSLKEKGAGLDYRPVVGRSGNVSHLGVSSDGRWMLFDQGKMLHFLAVQDGQTLTTLRNPADTTPFETLAIFSSDSRLMLTAGAAEGRLQLWRAPTDGKRGYELYQFVTKERTPSTCAAFAWPETGDEIPFAVSGSKDGHVYLWPVPRRAEVESHRIKNVPLKLVGTDVQGRQIRIGVEVPNPDGRLLPGRPVTIVIED